MILLQTQWNTHGGECGVCGDEYKPNGEGAHVKTQNSRGKFYTNVIGHNFTEGQVGRKRPRITTELGIKLGINY